MDMDHNACYRAISTRDARFDGRLFVGVKTTGIYCRPICPARTPKRENISFFPARRRHRRPAFAPACAAGRRPRPTRAPGAAPPTPSSRALGLIEAAALDEADVEGLADRLGVGERQLRRLFRQHLGASPIAVAQTRRDAAGQAIDPRDALPMAEVALAAGFGSVRRFNETFQQLFGRPPATLRRARRPDQAAKPARCRSALAYRPPYDWDAMLAFLAPRAIPGVEAVVGDDATRARSRSAATCGVIGVAPADEEPRRGHRALSRYRPCRRSSPGCGACSTWPPIPSRSARISPGPGAGAAGRGAAGPARPGRLGRLRARGARHPRPADHRAGRDRPRRQAGRGPRRRRCPRRPRTARA